MEEPIPEKVYEIRAADAVLFRLIIIRSPNTLMVLFFILDPFNASEMLMLIFYVVILQHGK